MGICYAVPPLALQDRDNAFVMGIPKLDDRD